MIKVVDYTTELYEFCTKYKINLIGEYSNVKNTTPIFFKCFNCGIEVKKSYKLLTKYKGNDNICVWENLCHRCFRIAMH